MKYFARIDYDLESSMMLSDELETYATKNNGDFKREELARMLRLQRGTGVSEEEAVQNIIDYLASANGSQDPRGRVITVTGDHPVARYRGSIPRTGQ